MASARLLCAECSYGHSFLAADTLTGNLGFPPRRSAFDPGSGQVGFVVDKVALGQIFSEYLGFPCQSSFTKFPIIIITWGRLQ
jgi:hypothetical protein